jgi:hypothetical protein
MCGHSAKEYCTGYHDGAIQANRDYKTGNDLDVDQHRCTASALYCDRYDRGYNDQSDFLGQTWDFVLCSYTHAISCSLYTLTYVRRRLRLLSLSI